MRLEESPHAAAGRGRNGVPEACAKDKARQRADAARALFGRVRQGVKQKRKNSYRRNCPWGKKRLE